MDIYTKIHKTMSISNIMIKELVDKCLKYVKFLNKFYIYHALIDHIFVSKNPFYL